MAAPFTVRISAEREYQYGGDVKCNITITNNSSKDYQLLVRHTPLEGLKSHIFTISRHGRVLPYDGIMVKRGAPSPSECVLIKANSSLRPSVDLSHTHSLHSTGVHEVQLKMNLQFHEYSLTQSTSFLDSNYKVASNRIEFLLKESPEQRKMTKGAVVRKQLPASSVCKKLAGTGPIAPKTVGKFPNSSQLRDTLEAFELAYRAIDRSIQSTTSKPTLYEEWFGTPYNGVPKHDYTTMRTAMESKQFILEVNTDPTMTDCFAYTHKGDTTIYLCDLYFATKLNGTDCKVGAIVHEMSHAAADTDDVLVHGKPVYGQNGCRQVAIDQPDLAVKNADNYEYFSEAVQ